MTLIDLGQLTETLAPPAREVPICRVRRDVDDRIGDRQSRLPAWDVVARWKRSKTRARSAAECGTGVVYGKADAPLLAVTRTERCHLRRVLAGVVQQTR